MRRNDLESRLNERKVNRPLISVIICNYNYAHFLRDCIDSAMAIKYGNKEILVIDDGSTDDSRDVISEYGKKVRAFFKPNGGQINTSNFSFKQAQGDLIFFLDADDLAHPDVLDEVSRVWALGTCKVQFPLFIIDRHGTLVGNIFPTFSVYLDAEKIRRDLLLTGLYPCPPTSGNIYARWYLERLFPLDEKSFKGVDGPLNTVAPLYGDVLTVHKPLGYYRVHESNDWSQAEVQPQKFSIYIADDLKRVEYLQKHAEATGHKVVAKPLDNSLNHLVSRLASKKFMPEKHPLEENIFSVMYKGVRAALFAPNLTPGQRLVMAIWFPLVTMMPRPIALYATWMRLAPTSRPALMRSLLALLNASRAAKSR
jgi:glycosyltransferase involved in cell wall biosynthesis